MRDFVGNTFLSLPPPIPQSITAKLICAEPIFCMQFLEWAEWGAMQRPEHEAPSRSGGKIDGDDAGVGVSCVSDGVREVQLRDRGGGGG